MSTQRQEPAEGLRILDDTGETLKFISQGFLDANAREATESTPISRPTIEAVTLYLSNASPRQKEICSKLWSQGWDDPAIYNLFTLLENQRKYLCAELRKKGQSEDEIKRLNELCEKDGITDFSHLKRPCKSLADDDYQVQLYLLEEWKRQKRIMIGGN